MKISELPQLLPGPVAILINEDGADLAPTIAHFKRLGFSNILVVGARPTAADNVKFIAADPTQGLSAILNPLILQLSGRWLYWGYNSEYLYFPFCETRTISDALQFVTEERREAAFGLVVDLYAADLSAFPDGLDRDGAMFDASGYFSRDRFDGPSQLDRQIHVHGGLKSRFSEHVPWARQPIERIALFRARDGLTINDEGRLSDPELNTTSAAWHRSLTVSIASFRAAKSLMTNPGSAETVKTLAWSGSRPFNWTSTQLMEHGFMEPGQWF